MDTYKTQNTTSIKRTPTKHTTLPQLYSHLQNTQHYLNYMDIYKTPNTTSIKWTPTKHTTLPQLNGHLQNTQHYLNYTVT